MSIGQRPLATVGMSPVGGRKILKAAAVLIALGYCSLLVYQSRVSFNFQERVESDREPVVITEAVVKATNESDQKVNRTLEESKQNKQLVLDDVFISVKTTKHYQDTRLPVILKTWFQLAKNQTWFFTDTNNETLQKQTDGHMINTNCSTTHQRKHLCCKTSVEYDYFIDSGKKWFCHFDDDNYVNIPRLVTVLRNYSHQDDWYLGRMSVNEPVKIYSKLSKHFKFSFWFATGGAGFCISKSLALKMMYYAGGGRFISYCEHIRFPDDVTIGYIIERSLQGELTFVSGFHSHLEQMKLLPPDTFKDQISFSYSSQKNMWNVVNVPFAKFDQKYDPTRFLSLHCFLFPQTKYCLY